MVQVYGLRRNIQCPDVVGYSGYQPRLAASQISKSVSAQRVQPGLSVTGFGKAGSAFAQRHGVER